MRHLILAVVSMLCWALEADATAVFAHFMVTNSANYSTADWTDDIQKAQAAHIDAFALNMAVGDATNEKSVAAAFQNAERLGFQLFFSFDYAGNGPWPQGDVISFINSYAGSSAHFRYQGKPFVSTFEGPDQANDWHGIKDATGCFFMPSWSSKGAKAALELAGGVADGLFSWAAWPWGNTNMDTYVDASYKQYLNGKPYMMPVSPWFYTNLPGYNKNWMWRGDDLWFDRWQQVLWWLPEFVEIITWNDYGESHHIGPVRQNALEAFAIGKAPYNYVLPHDGWRETLPFSIDMYKTNTSTVTQEKLTVWYRLNPSLSCSDGGTSGNTASQLQVEFNPGQIVGSTIFFTALLTEPADVQVTIGGESSPSGWFTTPEGGVGLYHGRAGYFTATGAVNVQIIRGGAVVAQITGQPITDDCSSTAQFNNWDAWVGSAVSSRAVSAKPNSRTNQVCVNGTGPTGSFDELCGITCSYGYCPEGACHCTKLGAQKPLPKALNVNGYPAEGKDTNYDGLCSFACNYGFCLPEFCDTTKHPDVILTVSPFLPPTCIGGEAASSTSDNGLLAFDDLCRFTCAHGYCPIAVCKCNSQGVLNLLDPTISSNATVVQRDGVPPDDHGLCAFACDRDYCPSVCESDEELIDDGYYLPDYDPVDDEIYDPDGQLGCDDSLRPGSLDDLANIVDSLPAPCGDIFAMRILSDSLDSFQQDYDNAANGYDDKFGYYVEWVKEGINPRLQDYMNLEDGPGNKYFSCMWTVSGRTDSGSCPPSEELYSLDTGFSLTYTLTDSDGFFNAVLADLGMEQDWIKFGDIHDNTDCAFDGTDTVSHGVGSGVRPCRHILRQTFGMPMQADSVTVANPKDLVQAAIPSIGALSDNLLAAYFAMNLGYVEDTGDMVTAASMPVLMLESAVASMNNIKEIGAEQQDRDKKSLILEILSIVLLVIPFVGEAVGAAFGGAAMVARIALLIGELGNVALTVQGIIDDPLSAPFAILSLLVGVGGSGSAERSSVDAYRDAAAARRGLSADKVALFGSTFADKDSKFQKIINACLR